MFKYSNVVVTGGTLNNHTVNLQTSRGIDRLEAATAPAAFHNSRERFDPPKCHPHTREAVLKKILEWIQRKIDTHAFVMWLYGAAGAGKSAIAQTIAEICYKEGLLLASFFFARSDSSRNTTEHLVATLAYQTTLAIPGVRGFVETAIENDPLIFTRALDAQFATLVLRPLEQLKETGVFAQVPPPALIILDGLDECMDDTRTHLLNVISDIAQTGMLTFLIASRSEQDISTTIRFGSMEKVLAQIGLDNEYQSYEDIELFLRDRFDEIKRTHPLRVRIPPSWPADEIIRTLVEKSSGQFIYAATALRYVSSIRHRPTTRLDIILGTNPPLNENDTPFAQLDALYMHIISSTEDPHWTVRLISACLSLDSNLLLLEDFLDLPRGDGGLFLIGLTSIIECEDNEWLYRVLHASLGDFLFDVSRSRQFHVDPQTIHDEISLWCLARIINIRNETTLSDTSINKIWECAAKHCPLAQATPQLIEKMYSGPLRNEFESSLEDPETSAVYFLDCIKDMKFEGAKSLYEEYLSIFDQRYISYLDNNSFTILDIIYIRDHNTLGCRKDPHIYPVSADYILLNVLSCIFGGRLKRKTEHRVRDGYFIYFAPDSFYRHDFFDISNRSGRHAIHNDHYIISAEKCVEYLLNPHHTPIQGLQAWSTQSRKRAWLWRIRYPSIIKFLRRHWRLRFWKKYVKPYKISKSHWDISGLDELPLEPLLVVSVVLTILPSLLLNAVQGSTGLATLCEKLVSGRLPFFIFPKQSRVAKRAIKKYLVQAKREEGR